MTLTPQHIDLVKQTWMQVLPIADEAATLFYARLFELDPALRPLFTGDMEAQGRKLTAMIGTAVQNLERLSDIVPAVQNLGRRHVAYGVTEAHYTTVGDALLWTLEQGLGPAFTPAVKEAWTAVYGLLAETMIGAAREAA